jgi:predicted HAD superfamily phosphohydrolase YqeG
MKSRKPDFMAQSVHTIDYKALQDRGVRVLAFDVDLTLGPMGCSSLDTGTAALLHSMIHFKEFEKILLGSNSTRDMTEITRIFDGVAVSPGGEVRKKPHYSFFEAVHSAAGDYLRSEIAYIGDKLLWDTSPAGEYGFVTVLVNPLGQDLWSERVVLRRTRERRHLRRLGVTRP